MSFRLRRKRLFGKSSALDLGIRLLASYELTGKDADLNDGLHCLRSAVSGADDASSFASWNALGSGLHALYERTGDHGALLDAIDALKKALGVSAPDQVRTRRESLVAISYGGFMLRLYERDRDPSILDNALSWLLAARRADQRSDRDRLPPPAFGALCANLSVAWLEQYKLFHQQADLEQADEQARRAVRTARPGSADETAARAILAQVLAARYEFDLLVASLEPARPADAENLIDEMRAVADATPPDRPDYAARMANFGLALMRAGQGTADQGHATGADEAFSRAAESEAGPPRVRIEAALAAARLAAGNRQWDQASQGFTRAIDLLELAVPASLGRLDREHQLERLRDLASDAAACALKSGGALRAAEVLEQARGVLLAHELYVRSDLRDHGDLPAELKERFDRLRGQVEQFGGTRPAMGEERLTVTRQWGQTLSEIREIKGLNRFMMAPASGELTEAARLGPIVLVFTSRYGSAGLVIRPDGVDPVRLPDLSPETARAMTAELLTLQHQAGRRPQERLTSLLGWIWDVIAMPIMNSDAMTDLPGPGPPRLWWCPSGLLSLLPLHAAGHHSAGSDVARPTVLDRVVSSYSPTIRALLHARTAGPVSEGLPAGKGEVIAIAIPDTPGAPELRAARGEAEALSTEFGPAVVTLVGSQANRKAVLRALPDARLAHFACHGTANLTSPSMSCLHLIDGPLTVTDIIRLRIGHGELAYLSACSTAQPGTRIADETIHLTSAFQLAGFRHVIGTLWPVADWWAAALSRGLYTAIKASPATIADTASALHSVTRQRRDQFPDLPTRWASHIHSGA